MTKLLTLLLLALAVLSVAVTASVVQADHASSISWKDPYPTMPIHNDPAFVVAEWHPGPMVDGSVLEYRTQLPPGDTTALPLIVVGGAGDNSPAAQKFSQKALVVFIGPSPDAMYSAGVTHNRWLLEKIANGGGEGCSPVCPAWMFVPAAAIRDVLVDVARHVRFAHDRVQMFANSYTRYDIYRALDPILQPYFAGVAHAIYAEWQQATCPEAAKATASPPRIYFSWGGCDASFCPTMECMKTLESNGYTIDPSSAGDTTAKICPCPASERPHVLPAQEATREVTYDWLLTNVRK